MDAFAQSRVDIDLFSDDDQDVVQVNTQPKKIRLHQVYIARQAPRANMNPRDHASKVPPLDATSTHGKRSITNMKNPSSNAARGARRVSPVCGDRSLTGGTSKPKISEEELSARLDRIHLLNARNIETHRRQMADKAAFQNQDKIVVEQNKTRERKERAQQAEMERERLKNRERKIKCAEKREWDMGKTNRDQPRPKQAAMEGWIKLSQGAENNKWKNPSLFTPDRRPEESSDPQGGHSDTTKSPVNAKKTNEWEKSNLWEAVTEWRASQSLEQPPEKEAGDLPSIKPAKEWEDLPSSEPKKQYQDWADEMSASVEEKKETST